MPLTIQPKRLRPSLLNGSHLRQLMKQASCDSCIKGSDLMRERISSRICVATRALLVASCSKMPWTTCKVERAARPRANSAPSSKATTAAHRVRSRISALALRNDADEYRCPTRQAYSMNGPWRSSEIGPRQSGQVRDERRMSVISFPFKLASMRTGWPTM
jgi:hypothetical protein